jgi:hypothetical protein
MSSKQHQWRGGIAVSCALFLAPPALSCAVQATAREDTELTDMASAALLARPTGCGERFVAPNGSDTSIQTPANQCRSRHHPCRTLNHAINGACAGDQVSLASGLYSETVIIDKSITLVGAGWGTVVYPALSNPLPCSSSSLCDGQASNVITIRASNVGIRSLVVDGDNPTLTSGVIRNGADIDARNGIIVDYASDRFDALTVSDVRVENVYFRGIDAASGGSFTIRRNFVRNVAGDSGSVAILNFGGTGTILGNAVDMSNDAIASNHSTGVLISHNYVANCASGIHSDNAGDTPEAFADRIESNKISSCATNGYGVYTFAPYVAPVVRDNSVSGCLVGLAALGQGATVTPLFIANHVDARGLSGSVGAFITTSESVYGSTDIAVDLVENTIRGAEIGLYLQQESGHVNASQISCNRFERNGTAIVSETVASRANGNWISGNGLGVDARLITSGSFDAAMNWWGCATGPSGSACDGIVGNVDAGSPLDRPPSTHHCARGRSAL